MPTWEGSRLAHCRRSCTPGLVPQPLLKLPADFLGYRLTTGGDQRHIGFAQKYARGYWWKSFFIVGYYFELVADGQLQAFKADPNNKGRYL